MKQIFTLFLVSLLCTLSKAQTSNIFNITSYAALPSGWVGTNSVTTEPIVKSTYFLLEAGTTSDDITTSSYDLSTYSSARFYVRVATFGSAVGNNPAKIEISYDNGMSYTQTATTATPSSSTYLDGFASGLTLTGTLNATVKIRISNSGTSGRGVRLQAIRLEGTIASGNSTSSDIVTNPMFTPTTNVDYKMFTGADVTASNSIELGQFILRDGGAMADMDVVGTTVSSLSFSLTSSANFDKVALYNGTTEIMELPTAATLNFTGLTTLIAADDMTSTFSLRATYKTTVTDNAQPVATITAANAAVAGSGFAATNGGGAATSNTMDDNRIEVTADRLAFVQNAITPTAPNVAMNPAPTVTANDINNNRDLDFVANIDITSSGALSMTPQSSAAVAGLATFTGITHTAAGTNLVLTATASTLTVNSTPFDIAVVYNGLPLLTAATLTTIDFDNTLPFVNIGQLAAGISNSGAAGTLNSNTWAAASSGSETSAAAFNTNVSATTVADPGITTSGSIFPMNIATGNRALGIQPTSSSYTPGFIALKIQNNLGTTLNKLDFGYTLYGVNDGGQANLVKLYFSTDNVTYTEVAGLNYNTITAASNTTLLKQYRAHTFSGLNIANGDNLYIKWFIDDFGSGSGNRDELAIDDIQILPNSSGVRLPLAGTFQTVTVNADISLTGGTTITDSLGILGRALDLKDFNLNTPKVFNQNNGYMIVNGLGEFTLNNVGTTPKLVPIGASGSYYTPVIISNAGTVDNFTFVPKDEYSACLNTAQHDSSVRLVIDIKEAVIGNSDVTLSIKYNNAVVGTHFNPILAAIAHCATGNVIDYSGSAVNGDTVSLAGIKNFSPFFITSTPSVLPTKIKSFVVERNNTINAVKWIVADQTIGDQYIVETSENGANFFALGTITANINTNYSFDHIATTSTSYYRLKVKLLSGAYYYSAVIKVSGNVKTLAINNIYPQPTSGQTAIQLASTSNNVATVKVLNSLGALVYTQNLSLKKGTQIVDINFGNLMPGVYQLQVISNNQAATKKLVVQ